MRDLCEVEVAARGETRSSLTDCSAVGRRFEVRRRHVAAAVHGLGAGVLIFFRRSTTRRTIVSKSCSAKMNQLLT
jgi:hypothetical protein